MSKRPSIDLMALTSDEAAPMPEAEQRTPPRPAQAAVSPARSLPAVRPEAAKTANLEALAFKVPRDFRKQFRQAAAAADLKLNELLFESFAAWTEKRTRNG
jgi:hypothetical protein